jgi:arylsulfatase A-like enzyme
MWGGVDDPEDEVDGYDPMTHMEFATATADDQIARIIDELEDTDQLDDTLVVLTADHGSVAGRHFHGDSVAERDYGFFNWYYGEPVNDAEYLMPQEALQPLTDTGNVGFSYSDSSLNVWLKDRSSAKLKEAAEIMEDLPDVTAVWRRDGDHFDRVSPVRRDRMTGPENAWFSRKAQELVDTQAAPYGPDLVATLRDNTTYSVAGDHGGIQRASQQIPIVFAGGGVSHKDLQAEVRSIDIMPTILKTMGIKLEKKVDGKGYELPMAKH